MPLFSRRNNLVPQPASAKPGEISERLRTLLWNDFDAACRELYHVDHDVGLIESPEFSQFLEYVWSDYWARPADDYPGLEKVMSRLKTGFLQGAWFLPFDVLELAFLYEFESGFNRTRLRKSIARRLNQESSAYMLVGNNIIERMSGPEAQSVTTALSSEEDAVRAHFEEALKKLSDRQNPDYRNSIKESISAVESACKKLTGDQSGDLNRALQKLDARKPFHPAFKQSLEKLYAWTSDESGIRHSIKDAPTVTKADAQFMLVTCSAFVNYLFARDAK